ncbi:hypothetical protein VCR6J2_420039 [Vibrio coralliirubri]|nr:hypothetical protein VCR6J2_420039 [Vibrio coralliirubri]CDT93255.1 hypothetical protein VCR8J2_480011 [Vibrio coralliirubri]
MLGLELGLIFFIRFFWESFRNNRFKELLLSPLKAANSRNDKLAKQLSFVSKNLLFPFRFELTNLENSLCSERVKE